MKNIEINTVANTGKQIAKYSAILGLAIFLLFCVTRFESLMMLGFFYLLVAAAINAVALLALLIEFIINARQRNQLLIAIGIMLLNIPLSVACATIALRL